MIIEHYGNLPKFHGVIKIVDDTVHIIGAVTNFEFPNFILAYNLKNDETFTICWDEIKSLSVAVNNILICAREVTEMYQILLTIPKKFNYIDMLLIENKTIGCLSSSYRSKIPLRYNLNNFQLILVLCDEFTRNNYESDEPLTFIDIKQIVNPVLMKFQSILYRELNLLPQHFAHGICGMIVNSVMFGTPLAEQKSVEYCPAREMTSPPRFNRPPPFEIPFELPPPYLMSPSLSPPRPYYTSTPQLYPQQQFEAHQLANILNHPGVLVTPLPRPHNGFFPNNAQNNIHPFWAQNNAPNFPSSN